MDKRISLEKKIEFIRKHGTLTVYKKAIRYRLKKDSIFSPDFTSITYRSNINSAVGSVYRLLHKNYKPLNVPKNSQLLNLKK